MKVCFNDGLLYGEYTVGPLYSRCFEEQPFIKESALSSEDKGPQGALAISEGPRHRVIVLRLFYSLKVSVNSVVANNKCCEKYNMLSDSVAQQSKDVCRHTFMSPCMGCSVRDVGYHHTWSSVFIHTGRLESK